VPSILANGLWQQALARWADILQNWPDLEPAVSLQRSFLRIALDQVAALLAEADDVVPVFSADPLADKLARGLPVLRGEPVPIPGLLQASLPLLCDRLADGDAPESARHLGEVLRKGQMDAGSLLAASLARNEGAIRTTSLHLGLSPDLVWLVAELAISPFAYVLQRELLPPVARILETWDRGYCPACGSWPALIEVVDGVRILRCSFCAAPWTMMSYRCIYCGASGDRFVAAAPDPARAARRLELCGACGGYTKVVGAMELAPFPLLAIEDLASLDLDRGAIERGYGRPPLADLSPIEPGSTADGCAGLPRWV
jgi:FdhE protein